MWRPQPPRPSMQDPRGAWPPRPFRRSGSVKTTHHIPLLQHPFRLDLLYKVGARMLRWGFGSRVTARGHSGAFLLVFGTSIVIDLGLGHSPLTPRMCAASEFSSRSWSVQESFLARAWVSATLKGRLTHKSAHVKAM